MTTSLTCSCVNAAPTSSSVRSGQSVPTATTRCIPLANALAKPAWSRAPRSPSAWGYSATDGARSSHCFRNQPGESPAYRRSTVTLFGNRATQLNVCRTSVAWRAAAPSAPSAGISRVLHRPGSGCFANISRQDLMTGRSGPGNLSRSPPCNQSSAAPF